MKSMIFAACLAAASASTVFGAEQKATPVAHEKLLTPGYHLKEGASLFDFLFIKAGQVNLELLLDDKDLNAVQDLMEKNLRNHSDYSAHFWVGMPRDDMNASVAFVKESIQGVFEDNLNLFSTDNGLDLRDKRSFKGLVYVIKKEEKIVGTLHCMSSRRPGKGALGVFVDKDFARQGIARSALTAIGKTIKAKTELREIIGHVAQENKASNKLIQSLGLVPTRELDINALLFNNPVPYMHYEYEFKLR